MSASLTSLHELLAHHVPTDDKEREDLAKMRVFASVPARKPGDWEHLHLDVRFLVVAENPEALAQAADENALTRLLRKARAVARAG